MTNAQIVTAVGTILAVLGVLYSGSSYLDKRFQVIKAITRGLIIGIAVAIFFILFFLISASIGSFVGYLSNILLVHKNNVSTGPTATPVDFSIEIPGGLIVGAVLGMLYSLLRGNDYFARHLFQFGLAAFLLMLSSSIGIEVWYSSPALFSAHPNIFSIILYGFGDIGGCLFGIVIARISRAYSSGNRGRGLLGSVIARINASLWRNLILSILIFILVSLPLLLLRRQSATTYEDILDGILHYAQLGLLIGVNINASAYLKRKFKRGPKENFMFWLMLGGILIPLASLFIFSIDSENSSFIFFIQHYFLLLGIVNSQGDELVKRIKIKGHAKEQGVHYAIGGRRFVYGLIIGILYALPAALFYLLTDMLLGRSGYALYDFSQNINFALLVGLILGFIYGFGPFIISTIDNLEERQLGQLGIIITELGIIVAILPH